MAKVTGPLLSLGAGGSIAKTQVYSTWKGRPYVRRHVIPSNPDTSEQRLTRNLFTWANNVWKNSPAGLTDPWNLFATGQVLTGRNAFVGKNVKAMREETDLDLMVFSPGAKGGVAPSTVVATGGNDSISVAITAPAVPTGWTLVRSWAACLPQQDPQTGVAYIPVVASAAANPWTVDLTGLLDATLYEVGAWLEWEKPDESIAYSASLNDTATTT